MELSLPLSLGLFLGHGNIFQAYSIIAKKHGINSIPGVGVARKIPPLIS